MKPVTQSASNLIHNYISYQRNSVCCHVEGLKAGVVAGGIVIFACDSVCSRNMTNEIEENKLGHRLALLQSLLT